MIARAAGAVAVGLILGCDRGAKSAPEDGARAADTAAAARRPRPPRAAFPPARNACELIRAEEVAALVGESVRARREVLERPDESVCAYGPAGGWSVLYVTARWRGGRQEWEARQAARNAGRALSGIGDAALYGGILPSLVLSGDVLLEFAMPLLPDEEKSFPILAKAAVSRL